MRLACGPSRDCSGNGQDAQIAVFRRDKSGQPYPGIPMGRMCGLRLRVVVACSSCAIVLPERAKRC